jgi:hypothetical protein
MQQNLKNILLALAICTCMHSTSLADAVGSGITIVGNIYDANFRYKAINDADIEVMVSGQEAKIEYPLDKKGTYQARAFQKSTREVTITVKHPEYKQLEPIKFSTDSFEARKNIRLYSNSAYAEKIYEKSRKLQLSNTTDAIKAFTLIKTAIKAYPRERYYIYSADIIGKIILSKQSDDSIIDSIFSFIEEVEFDSSFTSIQKKPRCKYYLKLANYMSGVNDLNNIASNNTTYLQYADTYYNNVLNLCPAKYSAYQGRYLVFKKAGNNYDAINIIKKYFVEYDPISSQATVRAMLSDWLDLIHEEENEINSVELWEDIAIYLNKYLKYFSNSKVKGNKNILQAYERSKKVLKNG